MNDPIGHLPDEHRHQDQRDAAAGPPAGGKCRGESDWPAAYVEPHRAGKGGYWPKGMRFRCSCGWMLGTISALIIHTVVQHKRAPLDSERVPVT